MRWIADFAYLCVGMLYLPVALYNAIVVGKNQRGWGQRFGAVPVREPGRLRIWIHAVSLGEINATPSLIAGLREAIPGVEIVVSTTTDTGYARAVQLYGVDSVFRFPLDFSPIVSRVLRRINPSLIVLVELEVWYNLIALAGRLGIPVAVVNGRLTERSTRRFLHIGGLIRPMFKGLAWVGAQDEGIAGRFRSLGTPPERISVTSSLKWDTALVGTGVPGMEALAAALGIDLRRPVLVCGSTGPGEEALILDGWRRVLDSRVAVARDVHAKGAAGESTTPLLVIVPRKPERFDEVAELVAGAGFRCVRRSSHPDGVAPAVLSPEDIVLGDTMGEMRKFYGLARVVLVGRSLVAMGGSDPIEAAALGRAVLAGPHMENFQEPTRVLAEANALTTLDSAASLAEEVGRLLADRATAERMGAAGRGVVIANQGATKRTVIRLAALADGRRTSDGR